MTPAEASLGAFMVVGVVVLMFIVSAVLSAKNKPRSAGETHDSTPHAPDHGDVYVRDGDVAPD